MLVITWPRKPKSRMIPGVWPPSPEDCDVKVRLWPNPRLELSNETDRPFADQGAYSRSVGIAQEFPISGRLALAENVARVDVARALAEVNEAERKLVGDVTTAFFEIAVIDQKIDLRDGLIRSQHGRLRLLEREKLETMVCRCYWTLRDNCENVFDFEDDENGAP